MNELMIVKIFIECSSREHQKYLRRDNTNFETINETICDLPSTGQNWRIVDSR